MELYGLATDFLWDRKAYKKHVLTTIPKRAGKRENYVVEGGTLAPQSTSEFGKSSRCLPRLNGGYSCAQDPAGECIW